MWKWQHMTSSACLRGMLIAQRGAIKFLSPLAVRFDGA
jgi:hypothetical protein